MFVLVIFAIVCEMYLANEVKHSSNRNLQKIALSVLKAIKYAYKRSPFNKRKKRERWMERVKPSRVRTEWREKRMRRNFRERADGSSRLETSGKQNRLSIFYRDVSSIAFGGMDTSDKTDCVTRLQSDELRTVLWRSGIRSEFEGGIQDRKPS